MKPLAAAFLVTMTLASCSLFDYSALTSKRYALVYGVAKYVADPNGPNLSYPGNDAQGVSAMLAAQGYTVRSRWVDAFGQIFVDGAQQGLIGTADAVAPSKANITADVSSLSAMLGPNDVVVFYFSGHGMPDYEENPTHEWFVPYGSIVHGVSGYNGSEQASIEDNELGGILGVLGTARKVVILDTCNSGGFIGDRLEVDAVPPLSQNSFFIVTPGTILQAMANYLGFPLSADGVSPYGGAMVLSAAGAAESCYETPEYGHGVMTNFLLQAAASGDLNHDGKVTAAEVFSLVKAGIELQWNTDASVIEAQWTFEPHISGGPVDFVLF
jgi:hypothetical protein